MIGKKIKYRCDTMTSWIDRHNTEKADEFRLNKALKHLEDEDVEGLDVVIYSLEKARDSGLYEDLKDAFDSRHQLYPREKRMNYENMPKDSVYSIAHDNLDFAIPKFGYMMRFYYVCVMYRIIGFRYFMTIKRDFSEEDIQNVYLSGLDERLIFALDKFDEVSEWPQPSSEFFQSLKMVKWKDRNTKKFAKNLKQLKITVGYTHFGLAKYHHLSSVEDVFIKLLVGCSAVNDGRDRINKEDVVVGYKTYLKLLKTDITKYKARAALKDVSLYDGGYLVCERCNNYYKLQPGEKPEDFTDQCECGGKLKYYDNFNEDTFSNQSKERSLSRKNLFYYLFSYKLDPKLELKLYGIIMMAFACFELFFSLFILFFLQGPFFLSILSMVMGIFFLFTGTISFIKFDKQVYWLHGGASCLLLLQYWIINDIMQTPKWGVLVFMFLVGYFTKKATEKI